MSFSDPMSADFPFTIGIEEEYQVVDPVTRELRSYITQILERGQVILREQIKPEMHQSIVEVGTRPCRTVQEARAEVTYLRGTIAALAAKHGLKIVAAGTHPISSWMNQEITPFERYKGVVDEMQDLALQLLIFGMHVHVGMPNNNVAIELMNVVRYFLPQRGLFQFSAHRYPAVLHILRRVRGLHQFADYHEEYRQWQEDLVGHAP